MMLWLLWSRGRDEKPMAAMSHETALSLFELGDFNPAKIHVTVPPTFRRNNRLPKSVVLHRAKFASGEVTQLRGLTVCRPLRALCDAASSNPNSIDDLTPAAKEARQRGLITEREISTIKGISSCRNLVTDLLQWTVTKRQLPCVAHWRTGFVSPSENVGEKLSQNRLYFFPVIRRKLPHSSDHGRLFYRGQFFEADNGREPKSCSLPVDHRHITR